MWRVIETDSEVNVLPCDDRGSVEWPHIESEDCPCHPEVEHHHKTLIIHNYIN